MAQAHGLTEAWLEEQDLLMGSDAHEPMPGSDKLSEDKVAQPDLNVEELRDLIAILDAAEQRSLDMAAKEKIRERLVDELERLTSDPRSDDSPWLTRRRIVTLLNTIKDPGTDDQQRRIAEIEIQTRVPLHASWKARQLDDRVAVRAEATNRAIAKATQLLGAATFVLVAATIGLIVATIVHH